jgi:hypothetical protein
MRKINLLLTLAAIVLVMSAAQAAPKRPKPSAPVDHIQTVCKTSIHDTNGKLIGQRVTTVESKGLIARVSTRRNPRAADYAGITLGGGYDGEGSIPTECSGGGSNFKCWEK